ncbi:SAM-dependent methyltransferase [Rhabdochromatium marinum]|uniref:SAM-dependent methyltransferase n=1 Tax=Rhabdochromatium marinum TaxID=48729 RepID=UPI001905E03E|nr:SAM-dependent methyltransferase [Rhabdochromatium marinum]MBK1649680.1 hypothetical protein [Rhabdochromatium marinum]
MTLSAIRSNPWLHAIVAGSISLFFCFFLVANASESPAQTTATQHGQLFLVSTGIGDPDNMTIRAHNTIQEADVVFGMQRVREQLSELLEGKETYEAGHGLFRALGHDQADKQRLEAQARKIIRAAIAEGKSVVVLDYGDPMIYGPQSGYLQEFADLDPVVVPGISSFNAANAALGRAIVGGGQSEGILLTRAPHARDSDERQQAFAQLAEAKPTLVLFTMRSELEKTVAELSRYYPTDTPIAIVMHAGDRQQEVMTATLASIGEQLEGRELPFEHLIYVGHFLQ